MTAGASEHALAQRFADAIGRYRLQEGRRVRLGKTLNADCVVHIGASAFLLRFVQGDIAECTDALPLLCTRDFTIKGTSAAWEALWERYPKPGWHDLFALIKRGEMSLEGDMQKVMAHLQFIKDVLVLPRGHA